MFLDIQNNTIKYFILFLLKFGFSFELNFEIAEKQVFYHALVLNYVQRILKNLGFAQRLEIRVRRIKRHRKIQIL
jgi:hypothetical protein